jgi:hypothetical protein
LTFMSNKLDDAVLKTQMVTSDDRVFAYILR